jgi:hypothetical protein
MKMRALLLSTLLATYVLIGAIGVASLPTVRAQNQTAGAQDQQPAGAQQQLQGQEFTANLTGDGEVPPVETNASGTADFELNDDGDEMSYTIDVEDLVGAMKAHIHQGGANDNGPVVVWLLNETEPLDETDGELTSGTFSAEDFVGPLAGKNMSDLVDLIQGGQAYSNVHTEAHQNGEIRGMIEQLQTSTADAEDGDDDQGGGDDESSG